ncbi:MAG: hypothetical protein GY923_15445 [Aestuariibacter sp.]|nr:hypothetical protein [Aestuariibacter sp.]
MSGLDEHHREYWFLADKDAVGDAMLQHVNYLITNQRDTINRHIEQHRLYSNREAGQLCRQSYNIEDPLLLKKNLIKSGVDTLVSNFAGTDVKLKAITNRGDWSAKKKASLLNQFTQGQFSNNKIHRKKRPITRFTYMFGKGFLHVYPCNGDIKAEVVYSPQMIYDESEFEGGGKPKQLYRVRDVSRFDLASKYPEHEDKIRDATRWDAEFYSQHHDANDEHDRITMLEGWRLPTDEYDAEEKTGQAGRYCMALTSGALIDEPWEDEDFPFAVLTFHDDDNAGAWPPSLVDDMEAMQIWMNQLLEKAYRQLDSSSWKVFVDAGAGVVEERLTNEDGTIIKVNSGERPPTTLELGSVDPAIMGVVQWLDQNSLAQVGISQLASEGKKPAGLDSGAALREYSDLGAKRLLELGKNIEDWYLDVGKRHIDLARRIAKGEDAGDYEIMATAKDGLRSIKWSEIGLESDQYKIEVFPVNFLSETPASKKQEIFELMQLGLIDKAHAVALLDMPDIDGYMARTNAPYEIIEKQIELMYDGTAVTPDAFTNAQLAGPMIQQARIQAQIDKAPEEIIALFDGYLSNLQNMIQQAQQAMQMQQQAQAQTQQPAVPQVGPPQVQTAPPPAQKII